MPSPSLDRLALTASSLGLQHRYWRRVFPHVRDEQRRWRRRALAIPEPALRRAAFEALALKKGNPQGAAIFASLAPPPQRERAARALVVFQTMYDYLDTLSELPGATSPANVRRLHHALVDAVVAPAEPTDYYALHPERDDGGYLREMVEACRGGSEALPAYGVVAEAAARSAGLLVDYQGLIGTGPQWTDAAVAWARRFAKAYPDMAWWEIVAATGSSLTVFALLAAAADPATTPHVARTVEDAYFPDVAVLHSLLDGLVDLGEDAAAGHHNLVGHYASQDVAAERLGELASRALAAARALPSGELHVAILCAMVSYYLAAPEASRPESRHSRQQILAALRGPVTPGMVLFGTRRVARRAAAALR